MCVDVEEGLYCADCFQEHTFRHDEYANNLFMTGVPYEQIPGPEWINTSDPSFAMPSGQVANNNAPMCSSCEQRINVTNHVCHDINRSIDTKDLISKLKVKDRE